MSSPTTEQLRAVYEVMRLLRDDDRERGVENEHTVACASCRRDRPARGAVRYGAQMLCNGCATDYELLRLSRLHPPIGRE